MHFQHANDSSFMVKGEKQLVDELVRINHMHIGLIITHKLE